MHITEQPAAVREHISVAVFSEVGRIVVVVPRRRLCFNDLKRIGVNWVHFAIQV